VKPTLRETIDAINLECPGIRERLIGADGKLRRFVTLYIDNTDCRTLADERHARKLKDPATPPEEAKKEPDPLDLVLTGFEEIAILPAIAGG
jgi:molybdopterin converting factor small subunit